MIHSLNFTSPIVAARWTGLTAGRAASWRLNGSNHNSLSFWISRVATLRKIDPALYDKLAELTWARSSWKQPSWRAKFLSYRNMACLIAKSALRLECLEAHCINGSVRTSLSAGKLDQVVHGRLPLNQTIWSQVWQEGTPTCLHRRYGRVQRQLFVTGQCGAVSGKRIFEA